MNLVPTSQLLPLELRQCPEVVAAVPYLMGFRPQRSLVLLCLSSPRSHWRATVRVDLPRAPSQVTPLVQQLLRVIRPQPRERFVAVLYDEQPWRACLRPWQGLLMRVGQRLAGAGADLMSAYYVRDHQFWGYFCPAMDCGSGRTLPPQSASLAQALSLGGYQSAPSRQQAQDRLRCATGPRAQAVQRLTATAGSGRESPDPSWSDWAAMVQGRFADAVRDVLTGGLRLADDHAAELLMGLANTPVRDAIVMRWSTWDDFSVHEGSRASFRSTPSPAEVLAAEQVFLALIAVADPQRAVAPLTLLGLSRWGRGGYGAALAIELAIEYDPSYRLAQLAHQAIRTSPPIRRLGPD